MAQQTKKGENLPITIVADDNDDDWGEKDEELCCSHLWKLFSMRFYPFTSLLTMASALHSVPVTTLIFDVDDTLYDVS